MHLDAEAFRAAVDAAVREAGLDLDDFVSRGQAGDLGDDRLRDLWLMVGPVLEGRT